MRHYVISRLNYFRLTLFRIVKVDEQVINLLHGLVVGQILLRFLHLSVDVDHCCSYIDLWFLLNFDWFIC